MTRTELAIKHNTYEKVFERLTNTAINAGQSVIVVDDKKYRFEQSGGRWFYEEVISEQLKPTAEAKQFLKQDVKKRRAAELRLEAVREYEQRGDLSWSKWLELMPKKYDDVLRSQRQFLRWVHLIRECPAGENPLALLVDKRGINKKEKSIDDEMAKAIEKMILEKPHRKTRRIYEYLGKNFKQVPTYETIRKFVTEWKAKEYFVFAFANNPDKAKGHFKPAGGSMSEGISFANELWELDATPADVICSDGKRYVISAAMDVYSRRVVLVVEESASYSTLAKVMRKAIKKFGVPVAVKIDNGKDYTSNYFTATCQRLRINQILCPPFSGEYKPHIERFFRTLSGEFFEEIGGYVGHNVAQRSDIQSRLTFKHKLESIAAWKERYKDGNEFAKRFALKKENAGLDVGIPLSRDELQMWCDKWIETYESRRHGGIKSKPLEKYNACSMPIKKVSDERMLDILLGFSTQRIIRKKGIDWNGVTYWSEMFGDMIGEKVWVLSDDDLSVVYIYSLDMNYLFSAYNPNYHNVSRSDFVAATKKYNNRVAKLIKGLEEIRAEAPERMLEKVANELASSSDDIVSPNMVNSEIGIEYDEKSKITDIEEALTTAKEISEKTEIEADVRINGRPTFTKRYDRFLWDLEHEMVDGSTETLAEKYPEMWDMAVKEHNRRKAG